MARIFTLPTFSDERGSLNAIEKVIDFDIRRVYYIYKTDGKLRGGHRHKKTRQVLVCVSGRCEVYCEKSKRINKKYILDDPSKCLIVDPEDWHTMDNFSKDCVLLVLASEYYDKNDYIDERY